MVPKSVVTRKEYTMKANEYAALAGTQDLMERAEQILMGNLSDESVLGQRFGPTPLCFSIRDIVHLFQWGATTEDTSHLSTCLSCREWVAKYAERPSICLSPRSATEGGAKHWFGGLTNLFGGTPKPSPQPALLHVCKQAVSLEDLTQPQEFVVVVGISDKVDADSLRLDGALIAKGGTVITQELCNVEYPVIRFDHVQVAAALQKDLEKHVALTDSICVHGHLAGGSKQSFCGKAHVRLVRDPAFKTVS
jgi:hypothetical protein